MAAKVSGWRARSRCAKETAKEEHVAFKAKDAAMMTWVLAAARLSAQRTSILEAFGECGDPLSSHGCHFSSSLIAIGVMSASESCSVLGHS